MQSHVPHKRLYHVEPKRQLTVFVSFGFQGTMSIRYAQSRIDTDIAKRIKLGLCSRSRSIVGLPVGRDALLRDHVVHGRWRSQAGEYDRHVANTNGIVRLSDFVQRRAGLVR